MKLICAPMATISHPAFRILVEKFGSCDEYYNEMINAPSLLNGGPFEKYYIDPSPVPEKMVWQLTGKDISSFLNALPIIHRLPGAGIDLNMGCCAPDIVRSGAGIAWMEKPVSETETLVREFHSILSDLNKKECEIESDSDEKKNNHKRFSVKCRLGNDDFTDESFFSFTDMLVKNGVERIALHPRTHRQKYRDKPRYEYAQKLALRYKNENVEIVVNGDICDEKSLSHVMELCPDCTSFMIGRAAVQKPWIFARLKNQLPENIPSAKDIAFSYIDDVVKFQPPEFWKTRLQRFFTYYCNNFSFAHYFSSRLLNAENPEDSKKRVEEYFDKVPEDLNLKIFK